MLPTRTSYTVILILSSLLTASANTWTTIARPPSLLARANTCPPSNPTSCQAVDPKLPSNFCCGANTICYSLDNSQAALCCPDGQRDCTSISPVSCDISLQNPTAQNGPIYTTNLSTSLQKCGSACCPQGYTCGSNGSPTCVLDQSKAIFHNNTGASVTTTVATSTTSTTVTSSPTSVTAGLDSQNPPPPTATSTFPPGVFLAGLFTGIVLGALAVLAWVCLTGRHQDPAKYGSDKANTRPFISAPIIDNRHSNERSDFLARTRSRARSLFSRRNTRVLDSPSMFGAKLPTPPLDPNIPHGYLEKLGDVPVTPARRVANFDANNGPNHSQARHLSGIHDYSQPEQANLHSSDAAHPLYDVPVMPTAPANTVAPLRGMNTRRRSASPPGLSTLPRRDSGTGFGIGSPFQTPERKVQPTEATRSAASYAARISGQAATATLSKPYDNLEHHMILTPARYGDPVPNKHPTTTPGGLHPTPLDPRSQAPTQQTKPAIPPRPKTKPGLTDLRAAGLQQGRRPSTQFEDDFDFDAGLSDDEDERARKGSPREKHTTAGTTFTTMLRGVGFPDPGNQIPGVPAVPKEYR